MRRKHRIIRTHGQRIAWTNTSRIPDGDIVRAIKFIASEIDFTGTVVHYKRAGRRWSLGLAYDHIPWETNLDGLKRSEWRYLITVTDQYSGNPRDSIIPMDPNIFNTLAHEARHIGDYREYGSRAQLNGKRHQWERRAQAFAEHVTDKWLAHLADS